MKTREELERFMKAGEATFTIENRKTGKKATFSVQKARKGPFPRKIYFVKAFHTDKKDLLIKTEPPENPNINFKYIGYIHENNDFLYGHRKARLKIEHPKVQTFTVLWRNLGNLSPDVIIHPAKNCARCGRKLTDPNSIRTGLGPICTKILKAKERS